MKFFSGFIKLAILLKVTLGEAVGKDIEQSNNNSSKIDVDNRINLNFNHAGAIAHNQQGGSSASHSSSIGFNAGLLFSDGYLESLGSHSSSNANSFATGPHAPGTFAETGTGSTKQGINGSAGAGYTGDEGNAWSTSNSDHLEIPLGEDGPLLLSNIKPINKTTKGTKGAANAAGASNSKSGTKTPFSDKIVFHD